MAERVAEGSPTRVWGFEEGPSIRDVIGEGRESRIRWPARVAMIPPSAIPNVNGSQLLLEAFEDG
jgi:hypothetical protein